MHKTLYTGAKIPAVGLGTFGSDSYGGEEISVAVGDAIDLGYRYIDCAACYGNEKLIGEVLAEKINGGLPRENLFILSKLWNDKHDPEDVVEACKKSLSDLKQDYLDCYLVHWPFPNYHPPECDADSRNPDSRPYIHEEFMKTWRAMEKLVDEGLVRHIGTSNVTIHKLKMILNDARIKPAVNEMELHPCFQQEELYQFCVDNSIQPIGYSPIGSPKRPERDRTTEDIADVEHPIVVEIAEKHGIHPALVCLKWAAQRGQIPIPFSTNPKNYSANLKCVTEDPLTIEEMEQMKGVESNCRLIKGQVFLWQGAKSWLDLWDVGETMTGAILPGNSTVELREFPKPKPKHGEVLIRTKATTICGSDIRCIYREHLGKGPEGYMPGMICGHEPCGIIEETGEGMRRFKKGDRVIVYHISGCGVCYDCRKGYMISCRSPLRRAYGWQRDGGMAPFILAEEKDLILLPDELSYLDGAQVACGFGTTYEALEKIGINGNDALLVVGLGPVGLATLQIAKAMGANKLIGVETSKERIDLAKSLGLVDEAFAAGEETLKNILEATGGNGVEKAVDTSASDAGRQLAIRATRDWGKIAFVGEGGVCNFNPSPDIIHGQKTIYGSWVTSTWKMEELVERIVRWGIHPDRLVTDKFSLEDAGKAFALMADGKSGKVAVVFD